MPPLTTSLSIEDIGYRPARAPAVWEHPSWRNPGDAVARLVLGARRVWSTLLPWASYFASGVAAGTVNSVAGGGSMLTFPTLLAFGMAPITANATNTVALIPGSASAFWGYRDVLGGSRPLVLAMALPSAAGGVLGAWLALRTGTPASRPWRRGCCSGATGLFALQEPVARGCASRRRRPKPRVVGGADGVPAHGGDLRGILRRGHRHPDARRRWG